MFRQGCSMFAGNTAKITVRIRTLHFEFDHIEDGPSTAEIRLCIVFAESCSFSRIWCRTCFRPILCPSSGRCAVIRDIQFGLRLLWKDRGYAATAILTLAICIGVNTAIFTIVHSVLLKPLPVPDSSRIVLMSNQYPNLGGPLSMNSAVPDYYDRLRSMNIYEEQAMYK